LIGEARYYETIEMINDIQIALNGIRPVITRLSGTNPDWQGVPRPNGDGDGGTFVIGLILGLIVGAALASGAS